MRKTDRKNEAEKINVQYVWEKAREREHEKIGCKWNDVNQRTSRVKSRDNDKLSDSAVNSFKLKRI